MFDKNGDGRVSAKELKYVMKKLGYDASTEQAQELIEHADVDGKNIHRNNMSQVNSFPWCAPGANGARREKLLTQSYPDIVRVKGLQFLHQLWG